MSPAPHASDRRAPGLLPPRLRRGLDTLLLVLPLVIVGAALAAIAGTVFIIGDLRSNALVMDVAGRQRMLCELHTKQVLMVVSGLDADHAATRRAFLAGAAVIRDGGAPPPEARAPDHAMLPPAPTPAIRDAIDRTGVLMTELGTLADGLVATAPGNHEQALIGQLLALDEALLALTDDVVHRLERHTAARITRLVRWGLAAAGFVALLGVSMLWLLARQRWLNHGLEREIDLRRASENAAHRNEKQLRAVLASTLDPIITINGQGTIQSASGSAERVFGWTVDELRGRNVRLLMPEPHRSQHDGYLAEHARSGRTRILGRTREFQAQRKDGTTFPCEVRVNAVDVGRGEEGLFAGIIRDISEQRERDEHLQTTARELEARNAEMEQFVYTVSHDLKSPLVTIRGFAGHFERDLARGNTARVAEDIEAIKRATLRMSNLIDDLIELSRVVCVVGEPEWVDLNAVVERSLSTFNDAARQGTLVTKIGHLPCLHVDPTRIQQVLDNLVGNAVKYGAGEDGTVHLAIDAERNGETVSVRVADRGPGIDPAFHEKIFNLFARLSTSLDGTGIGLAICKRVVEHFGGRIVVDSEPGRGAAFIVELPSTLADAPADVADDAPASTAAAA